MAHRPARCYHAVMSKQSRLMGLTNTDLDLLAAVAPAAPYQTRKDLVRAAQAAMFLTVDGDPGFMTKTVAKQPLTDIPEPARTILMVALGEVGNGEEGGNNSGPHVARYHGIKDDGDPDNDGSWCSSFVGWVLQEAWAQLGQKRPPVRRTAWARSMANRLASVGKRIRSPEDIKAGDIILWERGDAGGTSHIGFARTDWHRDGVITVEGNVGSYPSKVKLIKRVLRRPGKVPKSGDFLFAARLRDPRENRVA